MEQWNRDSGGWWNSDSEGRWISSTVSQSYDSKGGDKETSEMFILDFRITHQCLRSEPTRLYVAATDHSECIGRSASGSDRSQRHPLRVYWRICVKIFVSPTEFCRHNKSHKFCLI